MDDEIEFLWFLILPSYLFQSLYFGGNLDTLSGSLLSSLSTSRTPHHNLGITSNSSGYGTSINTTAGGRDPTPDQTSFNPRGLPKNEAADIGVRFRNNKTVTDRETADLAALVSRSMVVRKSMSHAVSDFEVGETQGDANEPVVNPLISKCFAANADGSLYEVTEKLLLRDVLYVFQGIEGRIIRYDSTTDSYKINKDIGISLPIRDLVAKLAELGWLFRRVQKFLSARAGDKALGLVGQSFCAAIQKELTEYYRLVAVLEGQENQHESAPGTGLTLRRLMIWTYDPLLRMKALATLVDVCKGRDHNKFAVTALLSQVVQLFLFLNFFLVSVDDESRKVECVLHTHTKTQYV